MKYKTTFLGVLLALGAGMPVGATTDDVLCEMQHPQWQREMATYSQQWLTNNRSQAPRIADDPAVVDSSYATKMVELLPAPGQFVGQLTVPHKDFCVGEEGTMVSLGGFGGYIVLEFAKPIVNDPHNPYGVDFTIHGNSFIANLYGVWTEPGAVMVMKDENHNGLPDDTWYELAGSDYYLSTTKRNVTMTYYNPHYQKRHTIPYTLNDGTAGAMRTNQFHQQSYFPGDYDFDCDRDSIAYTGNLIRGCIDLSTPSYIENYRAQLFGYCDNKGAIRDEVHNPYTTTMAKGGDGFDLDWAVDKDGNYVALDTVKWVKIYTSLNQDGGWLGELSTEVAWAQRVTPDPNYEHRNYYAHYIGIPQLKALVGQPIQYEGLLFKNGRPCHEGTPQWSLSNDSCGTIDQTGKFTPTHGGEVFVRFTQLAKCDEKDTIVVAQDSVRLRVVDLTGVVLEMEGNASQVSNDSTTLYAGEYTYITAQSVDNIGDYLNGLKSNRYSYDTYTWTTSHPEVGTIHNGLFHAGRAGRTMLYAYSNSNPALYDSILVIVKAPSVGIKNNTVEQNYKTPVDTFGTYDLFDASGATIKILSATAAQGSKAKVTLANDSLIVAFTQDRFGTQNVDFAVRAFNRNFNITLPFVYSASDILPAHKKMLFVNGGVYGGTAKTTLMAYNTAAKKTAAIGQVDATSVQDMIVDGAYAYVAADNYITRFNTSSNEVVAQKYVQDTTRWDDGQGKSGYGLNNKMAVYRNWLLVTRQNSGQAPEDGYNVRVYNKTDLSLVTKIPVSDQATDIAVVGTKAYVMINGGYAGTTSSMAVIDLLTLTLEKEVPMGQTGVNISMLIPKDSIIYAIRGDNYTVASAVVAFNTKTETFTETATNTAPSFSSAPAAIDPMTGDSILLVGADGFVIYNTRTGKTTTNEVMTTPVAGFTPMASTRDSETGEYYVTYGTWGGNGQGRIYNADFTEAGSFDGVAASPEAMAMSPAIARNDAPRPIAGKVSTNAFTLKETQTYASSKSIYKTSFSDTENNIDNVYLKNWSRYADWVTPNLASTTSAQTSFKFPEALVNQLGEDSIVHIYAEAIDSLGASYEYEAYTVTLQPAVYAIYAHPIADIEVMEGADDMTISLTDAFTWRKTTNSQLRFAKSVKENTNDSLVSTTLEGDNLTLSFAEGKTGIADITVMQTATYQQYTDAPIYSKSAETTFRVTVKSIPSALDDIEENSLVVYPNPFADHLCVNLAEAGTIRIYDLSGKCIEQVIGHAGINKIHTAAWANGVYIIKSGDLAAKVIK